MWRGAVDCSHAGWLHGDTILQGRTVEQVLIFRGAEGNQKEIFLSGRKGEQGGNGCLG